MNDLKATLAKLATGHTLSAAETEAAFSVLMSGEATPAQIGGFLLALRVRGESEEEFIGAVRAMRAKMLSVDAPVDAIDIVGTGGDAKGSLNISTATALVVAGAGVKVAKHGNRALSSKSGAADVLTELGVNIELSPGQISDCIEEAGVGFMFAPAHHSAMRFVGPARAELGTRTIFNLLGPMCNPARVKYQLLGVFSPKWLILIAKVLHELGAKSLWVVHGDGYDEITITGETQMAVLEDGAVLPREVTPQDFGLSPRPADEIAGGNAAYNAKALLALLNGEPSAYRDMVLMNAAAALTIAGKTDDIRGGMEIAEKSIDEGTAKATLDKLIEISNQGLPARGE